MTPTDLRNFQCGLISEIGVRIERYQFSTRVSDQSFLKRTKFGEVVLHLAFIPHRDDFDVTADIAIRHESVEVEFIRHIESSVGKLQKKTPHTYTLGGELGNLSEGAQRRWKICGPRDIPAVAESIMCAFAEIALPYFEEFSDLHRVLDVLSGDDRASWLHSFTHYARAERAVILALQLYGRDAARKLAASKLAFLEQRNDGGLKWFRNFLGRMQLD